MREQTFKSSYARLFRATTEEQCWLEMAYIFSKSHPGGSPIVIYTIPQALGEIRATRPRIGEAMTKRYKKYFPYPDLLWDIKGIEPKGFLKKEGYASSEGRVWACLFMRAMSLDEDALQS